MQLQTHKTLSEANLTFIRWIDDDTIALADDDEGIHIYARNDHAIRVIIFDGERWAFNRLATQEEQHAWTSAICGIASTDDEDEGEDQ